jgi:hypothetical protein
MERSIDRIVDIGLRKIPMQDLHTQYPQKVNVWAGIIDDRILGPFFFANNLTGDRYLRFLQLKLMPALAALFPNANNPDLPNNTIWLQKDGAPPHYGINVRRYVDQVLPGRWIGRRWNARLGLLI